MEKFQITKIVREIIKQSNIPLLNIYKSLGISRGTLHNWFLKNKLSDLIILKIGKIIHHDFTKEFPHLKEVIVKLSWEDKVEYYYTKESKELKKIHNKYENLSKMHREVIKYLSSVEDEKDAQSLKRDIENILKVAKRK